MLKTFIGTIWISSFLWGAPYPLLENLKKLFFSSFEGEFTLQTPRKVGIRGKFSYTYPNYFKIRIPGKLLLLYKEHLYFCNTVAKVCGRQKVKKKPFSFLSILEDPRWEEIGEGIYRLLSSYPYREIQIRFRKGKLYAIRLFLPKGYRIFTFQKIKIHKKPLEGKNYLPPKEYQKIDEVLTQEDMSLF